MKRIAMVMMLLAFAAGSAEARSPRIGDAAPSFSLPELSGKKVDFAGFKGRTTVLYFWNDLCGCKEQLLALKPFVSARRASFAFVTVNEGQGRGVVENVIAANKLPYHALLDPDLSVGKDRFGIKVLPTIFIIDRQGVVREKLIGVIDHRKLESLIQRYL